MPELRVSLLGAGILFLLCVDGRADSPAPRIRQICDPTLPENADVCIPDTFEVIFGTDKNSTNSVFEYFVSPPDEDIDVTIVTETKSNWVQGWSYGVEHDPSFLEILEATVGGTDGAFGLIGGFDATSLDVEKCDDVKCANRTDGGGFLSATVMDFKGHKPLLLQRNSLCKAKYRAIKDARWDGTYVAITNLLAARGSPPTDINVTVDGRSKRWTNATDGWVRKHNGGDTECSYELDDDADGKSNCEEAECLGTQECVEDNCIDGIDNEGDHKVDCDDEDCADKPCGSVGEEFNRADADGNGKHNVLDVVLIVRMILGDLTFRYDCQDILDANDDGELNITDALSVVEWVFKDGPDLPAPFRACARDSTDDALDCGESNCG